MKPLNNLLQSERGCVPKENHVVGNDGGTIYKSYADVTCLYNKEFVYQCASLREETKKTAFNQYWWDINTIIYIKRPTRAPMGHQYLDGILIIFYFELCRISQHNLKWHQGVLYFWSNISSQINLYSIRFLEYLTYGKVALTNTHY